MDKFKALQIIDRIVHEVFNPPEPENKEEKKEEEKKTEEKNENASTKPDSAGDAPVAPAEEGKAVSEQDCGCGGSEPIPVETAVVEGVNGKEENASS